MPSQTQLEICAPSLMLSYVAGPKHSNWTDERIHKQTLQMDESLMFLFIRLPMSRGSKQPANSNKHFSLITSFQNPAPTHETLSWLRCIRVWQPKLRAKRKNIACQSTNLNDKNNQPDRIQHNTAQPIACF